MKAMILAAGRGTRLKPLTDRVPKPLLEVQGRPLIGHQLEWLKRAGATSVVINLHHLGEQIRAYVGDGGKFRLAVHYSAEETLLETGGGIVQALPLLGERPFWVLNGDIFTDFPLRQFPAALPEQSLAHLLLTPRPSFRKTGDFDWAAGRITGRGNAFVYCGLALLHPALFAGRKATPFSLSELLFKAAADRQLSAQVWNGFWTDIGTPEQLRKAQARPRTDGRSMQAD